MNPEGVWHARPMKWVATRLICPLFSKQPIMKPDIAIQDLLFWVDQVPVEVVTGTDTSIELRHAYYLLHDPQTPY